MNNLTTLELLHYYWLDLCCKLQVKHEAAQKIWSWLKSAYTESNRYYHNFEHINDMLCNFDNITRYSHYNLSLVLSVWFHDVVYDPQRTDNEEKSVELLKNALGVMNISVYGPEVSKMIMLTKNHVNPDMWSESLFLDLDLQILGTYSDEYEKYEENIRKEYEWVPIEMYKEKRIEILQSFLNRPKIYLTKEIGQYFEAPARQNIINAIQKLSQL